MNLYYAIKQPAALTKNIIFNINVVVFKSNITMYIISVK